MKNFRLNIIIIVIVVVLAALAGRSVEAGISRLVYVNGKIHIVNWGRGYKSNWLNHDSNTIGSNNIFGEPGTTGGILYVDACNPDPMYRSAFGAAVFGEKIFFVFTGHPQQSGVADTCSAGETHIYVTAFDLATNGWDVSVSRDLGVVQHLNTVDSKGNPTDMAGAAIVVFKNLLYVFSDRGTYTSADGVNWTSHPGLPNNDVNGEPLDAIAYYPPDADPKIMIIYGVSSEPGHYNTIWGANWNGRFGKDSEFKSEKINVANHTRIDGGIALLAGTATPPPNLPYSHVQPGAKAPSLQLFLGGNAAPSWPANDIILVEYNYTQNGGTWAPPGWISVDYGFDHLYVFPWYTQECTNDNNVLKQNLVINYFDYDPKTGNRSDTRSMSFTSDAMVPQNTGIPLNCNSSGGTATDTGAGSPEEQATLRKYWTLVGVVMGSPPFAVNDAEDFEIPELSNVTYGQSQKSEVSISQETENSVMVSSGGTVQVGLKHVFGVKDEFDYGFKHAWESAHERSTESKLSYGFTLGTASASLNPKDADKLGMMGWAIFHVPKIIVQDYALYAYDYNVSAKTGTPIGQNVHTTQVDQDSLSYRQAAFELANPGGPNDSYPGLLAGIAPLTKSTDFTGWKQGWESNSSSNHYKTLLGDHTAGEPAINTITFGPGSNGSVSFSQEIEELNTTGETSDVEVSNTTSVSVGTKLAGFEAYLTVGYDGHFSNSVTTATTLGTGVEAELKMKECYEDDCIKTLILQPYLLQATDNQAPWIPAGYNSQLPWAMHWRIVDYSTVGGGHAGTSPLPDQASGEVVGEYGGAAEDSEEAAVTASKGSSYSIKRGRMAWLRRDGSIEPIPMKAQEFDPALGVSISLNGYTWWSSQVDGAWQRRRDVWTFRTGRSVDRNIVVLSLDFGMQTWGVELSKADLSPVLRAAEGRVHLALNVNGKYEFYFDGEHKVKKRWDLVVPAMASNDAPNKLRLSRYSGSYNPSTGMGTAALEGTLPVDLDYFGDISISVNGRQVDVPLITHQDYAEAIAGGKKLVYRRGGLRILVDFGKKTWSAHFSGKVDPLLAPRWGAAKIQVKVGGDVWYSSDHTIQNYTSTLM